MFLKTRNVKKKYIWFKKLHVFCFRPYFGLPFLMFFYPKFGWTVKFVKMDLDLAGSGFTAWLRIQVNLEPKRRLSAMHLSTYYCPCHVQNSCAGGDRTVRLSPLPHPLPGLQAAVPGPLRLLSRYRGGQWLQLLVSPVNPIYLSPPVPTESILTALRIPEPCPKDRLS